MYRVTLGNPGETIFQQDCSLEEALKEFNRIIKEQAHEYHDTKTLKEWRVIRLYDGEMQIRQES